jgi:hypothetical protein
MICTQLKQNFLRSHLTHLKMTSHTFRKFLIPPVRDRNCRFTFLFDYGFPSNHQFSHFIAFVCGFYFIDLARKVTFKLSFHYIPYILIFILWGIIKCCYSYRWWLQNIITQFIDMSLHNNYISVAYHHELFLVSCLCPRD